jgi:hypothetical protein
LPQGSNATTDPRPVHPSSVTGGGYRTLIRPALASVAHGVRVRATDVATESPATPYACSA